MISHDNLLAAKILIVDDQPANVMLLHQILEENGYQNIRSTTDSREVVPIYKEFQPDIVLLDLSMPHMDGFQVMEKLHDMEGSYASVLVLTAQADQETRLRALACGARDFLCKPFDMVEVLFRIKNMIETSLLQKELSEYNRLLEEKVDERTRDLEETRREVIYRLGVASEYRDNETGQHIVRISKFCITLGRAVGLNERECKTLGDASPMHDLGKIGIPDNILLKPGKLDPEEWEIMKMHCAIGASVLAGSDNALMQLAETIAFNHHEKWDGSGYPRGLKGDEIPLVAQIVAVADVFDALTSERPYKKAWKVDEAVNYMKEQSGRHFNPMLVDKFIQVLPKILEIREKFSKNETQRKFPLVSKNDTD